MLDLDFLKRFKCKFNKIASSMLTNYKLLEVIAKEKKHTFISTGMSNLKDIETAIKIFKKFKLRFVSLQSYFLFTRERQNI